MGPFQILVICDMGLVLLLYWTLVRSMYISEENSLLAHALPITLTALPAMDGPLPDPSAH